MSCNSLYWGLNSMAEDYLTVKLLFCDFRFKFVNWLFPLNLFTFNKCTLNHSNFCPIKPWSLLLNPIDRTIGKSLRMNPEQYGLW